MVGVCVCKIERKVSSDCDIGSATASAGPTGSSGAIMFFSDVLSWTQMVRPVSLTDQSLDVSHAGKGRDIMLDDSLQLR